jgi:glycosyltransferase involved in cell wall biosynthesis
LWLSRRDHIPLVVDWADWFGQGGSVEERPSAITRTILRPVETFYENHFRPLADANTVISSELKRKAIELGIPAESVIQIPDGGDSTMIRPVDPGFAKTIAGYSPTDQVIGYLGSLFIQDARFLADAWLRVVQRLPNAQLFWFGARPDRSVAMLENLPNVQIIRRFPQEKMEAYLSANDIGWLPLRNSAANRGRWPSKLNEYLCAGIPVIATRVGDVQEIFDQYPVGGLSQVLPQEFADLTVKLLGQETARRQYGLTARWVAENVLEWKILVERLEALYFKLVKHI